MRSTFNTPLLVEIQVQTQTKIQIQIQVRHLWGRHWTHSFSWKPTSSSVLNFFPQPRQTFVCKRKLWKFVSRLQISIFNVFLWDLVGEGMSCKTFFVLAILRKENWVLSTSKVPELLKNISELWKKSYGTNLTTLKTFRTRVTVLGADMAHLM